MKHFVFLSLLLLVGCQSETPDTSAHFYGTAMTMSYHIVVGSPLYRKDRERVQEAVDSTFSGVDSIFNRYNPASELSRLNSLGKNENADLSPEMLEIFQLTKKTIDMTRGKFDPTVLAAQLLWKDHLEKGEIPSPDKINAVSDTVGWEKIHVEGPTFRKDHDRLQLDLGGIAKGHCIDMLIAELRKMGYDNLFVEWGGEIRSSGKHPDDRPWTIMITRLGDTDPDRAIEILPLTDEAVASSGDYLQYWEVDGIKYCHIINPETLTPLQPALGSIAGVTVIAPTCALADALATAGMLFTSADEAKEWAESLRKENPRLSFWFITR